MSINLPQGDGFSIPDVPTEIKDASPKVYSYLVDLRRALGKHYDGLLSNDIVIQSAINSGVSGTFASTSSFTFVNGIFTATA